jgi:hypothetical protein
LAGALLLPGCSFCGRDFTFDENLAHFETVATTIEYPDVSTPTRHDELCAQPPRHLADPEPEYWDMTLQEAIQLALTNSEVLRDLGGTVLRSPENVETPYEPAIRETDPQHGVEAALSAFDAQLAANLLFEKNDRRLNNTFLGNLGLYEQDYDTFQAQLSKRTATGSQFALRKYVEFDNDNHLGNEFPDGAWTVWLDAEARHPLLQGTGTRFNRIAGPGAQPGVYNGVLIARVRTDVSLTEFEAGVRNFLRNVENAYWDLYYAYRDLQAKIHARDRALEIWRTVHAWEETGRRGGEAENEAQARALYLELQQDVQNALAGKPLERERVHGVGPFRPICGVHLNERRLRLMIGLPTNGRRLIRPADEPPVCPVVFDWGQITTETLVRRAELRRQRWQVKRRELELIASRNFLLPNLDLVGRYRWRGFGEQLIDSSGNPDSPDRSAFPPGPAGDDAFRAAASRARFDNAYTSLTDGGFQEWQLGLELSVPIGFRQAHAAVRNAELRLAREKAVLREQEREVVHDLSNAVADVDRAYTVLETKHDRLLAARARSEAIQTTLETQATPITADLVFRLLDAYRREADAESEYFQLQVEYALALRNVHFEKGTMLDYCGVTLAEGSWPTKAYHDAAERERLRGASLPVNYAFGRPPIVAQGP